MNLVEMFIVFVGGEHRGSLAQALLIELRLTDTVRFALGKCIRRVFDGHY